MKQMILASKSPRRKELLQKCDIPFICIPADIDETLKEDVSLEEAIKELSLRKAKTVFNDHHDAIVIGSDTIVTLNNKVLGKPKDDKDAFNMLKQLQGNTHTVITGLAILSDKRTFNTYAKTKVTFAPMNDEEILSYIQTGEGRDKAGSYGVQGFGGRYITKIDGDFYTVMGLPLNIVYEELKNISLY